MTIQARYSGTCVECGGRWQPGDLIRTETTSGPPQWQHAVCPDDDPLEATHPVCQTCWLTHPTQVNCDAW